MKLKLFITLILISGLIMISCKEKKNDRELLKEKLLKRMKEYQESTNKNNPDKMWELSSNEFKKIQNFNETEYIKGVKKELEIILSEFSSIEYSVEKIEIKDNKAQIVEKCATKSKKDNKVRTEVLYYCWVFENNDWYIVVPGGAKPCLLQ